MMLGYYRHQPLQCLYHCGTNYSCTVVGTRRINEQPKERRMHKSNRKCYAVTFEKSHSHFISDSHGLKKVQRTIISDVEHSSRYKTSINYCRHVVCRKQLLATSFRYAHKSRKNLLPSHTRRKCHMKIPTRNLAVRCPNTKWQFDYLLNSIYHVAIKVQQTAKHSNTSNAYNGKAKELDS